ncbi:MAG: ABC transporter ATP-binding protein [Candidatus Levybacteria bacterium]|nr:ABC transporter ATP-binding protein [Candidatus Levybacteria bacterium]
MSAISVSHLSKYYKVYKKESGFLGSVKSLIWRKYETVKAVDNISFDIKEGELIGFIGPNGAGKTTTLKCLSGLLYPTGGKISVLEFKPQERKNDFLKQISLVMGQKNQLWWDLPAIETINLNKEIYDVDDKKYKEVLQELSKLLEVEDFLDIPVRKLSMGQRMKCELIAALVHSPKVLFLDEPTIGLDVVMQKKLREFIKDYNEKYKATIILTSHYMGDVEALCKRVIILNFGKILFDGGLTDLIRKYAPYKLISLVLEKNVDSKVFSKAGILKTFDFPFIVLKVPFKNSSNIVSKILKDFSVHDLNIEDPDIEDVIREIFLKNA